MILSLIYLFFIAVDLLLGFNSSWHLSPKQPLALSPTGGLGKESEV